MPINDEDLNAQLETLQQKITLTLQAIDQNFEKCNQIVSGSILPTVDKFTDASRGVWDGSKLWLYFFHSLDTGPALGMQDTTYDSLSVSNRPPLPESSTHNAAHAATTSHLMGQSPWQRLHRELELQVSPFSSSAGVLQNSSSQFQSSPWVQGTQSTARDGRLGQMLQRQFRQHSGMPHLMPSATTATTTEHKVASSVTSDSTATSVDQDGHERISGSTVSPPRTVPFGLSPSRLLRTPAREAARMLVDDLLLTAGAKSPPSNDSSDLRNPFDTTLSSHDKPGASSTSKHAPSHEYTASNAEEWTENDMMAQDSTPARARFEDFMNSRQKRLQNMRAKDQALSSRDENINSPIAGPSLFDQDEPQEIQDMQETQEIPEEPEQVEYRLAAWDELHKMNTPNLENSFRHHGKRSFIADDEPDETQARSTPRRQGVTVEQQDTDEMDLSMQRDLEQRHTFEFPGSAMQDDQAPQDDAGAYEFSQILPSEGALLNFQDGDSGSSSVLSSTRSARSVGSNISISMMSSLSTQTPSQFSLNYFPSSFQAPPGSTQLTRIYDLFAEHSGQILSFNDVLDQVQDDTNFHKDNVRILLDLLTRKRFLKRVDAGWILRS